MIGYLIGCPIWVSPDSTSAILQVCSVAGYAVGYEIRVWPGFDQLFAKPNTGVWIWHVFSELAGQDVLFGFPDVHDRELAKLVAKTDGIGPSKAHSFVTQAGIERIGRAVQSRSIDELREVVKGFGPKPLTAIVETLATKGLSLLPSDPRSTTVALALGQLGVDAVRLDKVMQQILLNNPHATPEQIIHMLLEKHPKPS
jgi:Holliday junction resolvasome RuvABC DNA-binding subunit